MDPQKVRVEIYHANLFTGSEFTFEMSALEAENACRSALVALWSAMVQITSLLLRESAVQRKIQHR